LAPFQQGQSGGAGTVRLHRLATAHFVRLLGDWRGGGPAYVELAGALRGLIVEGRLPPHTRVASERALAQALGVSRNTVTAALDVLRAQGYLASRRGTGSWVTYPAGREARPDELVAASHEMIDLTVANLPAPANLGTLASAAADALSCELGSLGYEPFGLARTRAAVAEYLSARGLLTSPREVLITQGALHALDLALRAFARPGDRVLVETPTYPAALDAIRAHGCVPIGVAIGSDGWDLAMMRAILRDARPRLGYLIPDFHNPTGVSISDEQRRAVRRAAHATGTLLVSDESLAELWIEPRDRPRSLAHGAVAAGAGRRGRGDHRAGVLAVGSLSKAIWGGLRIGWIRADEQLVRRLALARSSQDMGSPVLCQLLAVQALRAIDAILPERRALLRERRDLLARTIAAVRPAWQTDLPAGGTSVWVKLPQRTACSALATRAIDHGVRVAPGSRFSANDGLERRIRLPFTQPPDRLTEAIHRLAAAEDSLARRTASNENKRHPKSEVPARWVA
jgi:DNA-binding transcriptional MocR family regulator